MKIRHKRYGAVESKSWGNVIKIVDNEDNNYSGKIINVNQNNQTSTHFHSKKQLNLFKTYVYKIIYHDEFTKKAVVRKIFPSTACIFCVLS